jgi:hypothetical protein
MVIQRQTSTFERRVKGEAVKRKAQQVLIKRELREDRTLLTTIAHHDEDSRDNPYTPSSGKFPRFPAGPDDPHVSRWRGWEQVKWTLVSTVSP